MKRIGALVKRAATAVYDFTGNPKSKNALLFILLAMTVFGIVKPETATSLRDTIVALAF